MWIAILLVEGLGQWNHSEVDITQDQHQWEFDSDYSKSVARIKEMLHKADTPFSYQITFPQSLALPDKLRVEKFIQTFARFVDLIQPCSSSPSLNMDSIRWEFFTVVGCISREDCFEARKNATIYKLKTGLRHLGNCAENQDLPILHGLLWQQVRL